MSLINWFEWLNIENLKVKFLELNLCTLNNEFENDYCEIRCNDKSENSIIVEWNYVFQIDLLL